MITLVLHCPYCDGVDIVRHGTSPQGKQRYRCREKPCEGRTFLRPIRRTKSPKTEFLEGLSLGATVL